MDNIDKVLAYYRFQSDQILEFINQKNNLTEYEIIQKGKKLEELDLKITALEIAKIESLKA